MKWLAQYKIKEIGRKEQNFDNIPDTAIQTTALVLSESSNEESSGSDATWGWCSDSNDQGWAEQVVELEQCPTD